MKNLLLLFTLFIGLSSFATVYVGNVIVNSQADITNFFNNNPGTTEIDGDLRIQGNNITDLSAFSNLTVVTGQLKVQFCSNLTSLSGLGSLSQVSWLWIRHNTNLVNISSLNSLTYLYRLDIEYCPSLVSLHGLHNITSVNNVLRIKNLSGLINCDMPSLQYGHFMYLHGINNCTSMSFPSLNNTAEFSIWGSAISSLSGFSNLQWTNHRFEIQGCPNLTSLSGLTSLTSVGYNFVIIANNSSLSNAVHPAVCQRLSTNPNSVIIHSNLSGANSIAEVLGYCNGTSTQLTAASCGAQLTTSNELFFCDPVANATQYEFEFTELDANLNPTNNVVLDLRPIPTNNLIYANLPYVGVSYNVRVRSLINSVWTSFGTACQLHAQDLPPTNQLTAPHCNTQLATFSQIFSCHAITDATDYEFEFVDVVNGNPPHYYASTSNSISLLSANLLTVGGQYLVKVRTKVNGVWSNFGAACGIITPQSVPNTQLTSAFCNTTLTHIGQTFFCDPIAGASQYRFRIHEQGSTAAPQEFVSPVNSYNLAQAGFSTNNTVYNVEVKAYVGGVWGNYSSICQLTVPVPPTQLQSSWCNTTLLAMNQVFSCDAVSGANQYNFMITEQGSTNPPTYMSNNINNMALTWTSIAVNPFTSYDVQVQARIGGTWGPFGSVCSLTTGNAMILNPNNKGENASAADFQSSGSSSLGITQNQNIELKIYPNPTSDLVNISADIENYSAVITSLTGQLIQSKIKLNGMTQFNLESIAAGIYLVLIQDENGQQLLTKKIVVTK